MNGNLVGERGVSVTVVFQSLLGKFVPLSATARRCSRSLHLKKVDPTIPPPDTIVWRAPLSMRSVGALLLQ